MDFLDTIRGLGRKPPPTKVPIRRLGGGPPAGDSDKGGTATASADTPVTSTPQPMATTITYGGLAFQETEITSKDALIDQLVFYKCVNGELRLSAYLVGRMCVVKLTEAAKDVAILIDRHKTTPDEVRELVATVGNQGYRIAASYFVGGALVMAISQGHISGAALKTSLEVKRDPAKNALFQQFTNVIAWAFINKADDVDWAVDTTSADSQVHFKIGGRYLHPAQFRIPSDTMVQMLGIAWQMSGGGSQAQFDMLIEQQAQITLELPPSSSLPKGARLRLRWSGMANDKGTVVTMRVQRLGASALVQSLDGAGYLPWHMSVFRRVIMSEGGLVCFSGVVGSGKSTSLARLLAMLPDDIKMISIEDPVELEIPRAYQKTVTRDPNSTGPEKGFKSAAGAVYRSALDVLYLGEIRDTETGGMARQVTESGHTVFSTTHARSALGVIDRLSSPQIGMPRDVLGAPKIIKLLVYQALLRTVCQHCALTVEQIRPARQDGQSEGDHATQVSDFESYWGRVERLFGVGLSRYRLVNPEGCPKCRKPGLPELNGLSGRTVVCEMVEPDEHMAELISDPTKKMELYRYWRSLSDGRYDSDNMRGKTAMESAIYKAIHGEIDPREIEHRFQAFETLEMEMEQARTSNKPTPGNLKAVA